MRTRSVSEADVRLCVSKAVEFGDAAVAEIEAGRTVAATSLAIHAAINAADSLGDGLGHCPGTAGVR
jgi:hypothetical protein